MRFVDKPNPEFYPSVVRLQRSNNLSNTRPETVSAQSMGGPRFNEHLGESSKLQKFLKL